MPTLRIGGFRCGLSESMFQLIRPKSLGRVVLPPLTIGDTIVTRVAARIWDSISGDQCCR